MEKINEKVEWSDVELLEDGMILTGGEEGTANEQAKALANRTAWLNENKAGEVNGKIVQEGKVAIEGKDILVQSGRTIQAELDQKSDTSHTHEGGGLAPEIKVEDTGKVLAINKDGTGTVWQVVSGNPVGTIIAWAGLTPPAGYLECAGQILKREIYKDLFKAIGTVWGTTAEENFKLPDFKSAARFLRSRGDGVEVGEVQGDAICSHFHYLGDGAGNSIYAGGTAIYGFNGNVMGATTKWGEPFRSALTGDNETRPKNAVVMYCIKAVDEYVNPTQVDLAKVAEENAKKAYREDVKELAGTRIWVSGEYQPVINTPTIVTHGLNIDPLKCKCDVLLKCIKDDIKNGYKNGDYAMGWFSVSLSGGGFCHPPIPMLLGEKIQYNTGMYATGIYVLNKNDGMVVGTTTENWRYIFRIWY